MSTVFLEDGEEVRNVVEIDDVAAYALVGRILPTSKFKRITVSLVGGVGEWERTRNRHHGHYSSSKSMSFESWRMHPSCGGPGVELNVLTKERRKRSARVEPAVPRLKLCVAVALNTYI